MFHHSDHYCSLVYERIQKKISRATVISAGNLFCVRARARACQKARGPEKRRKKKENIYGAFFSITKHYNLISITAPFSNLRGRKKSQQSLAAFSVRVFKPITLPFNQTARWCQIALFSPCISLPGSSSLGDLENVCSPERLPLSRSLPARLPMRPLLSSIPG